MFLKQKSPNLMKNLSEVLTAHKGLFLAFSEVVNPDSDIWAELFVNE
jgi:hypothetical protein